MFKFFVKSLNWVPRPFCEEPRSMSGEQRRKGFYTGIASYSKVLILGDLVDIIIRLPVDFSTGLAFEFSSTFPLTRARSEFVFDWRFELLISMFSASSKEISS